jgi:hypothetical protein
METERGIGMATTVKRAGKISRPKTYKEVVRDSKKRSYKGTSLNKKYGKKK